MKHQSPNQSDAHRKLRELAKASDHEEEIRDFLFLINAHDQLPSFATICSNLQKILNLLIEKTGMSIENSDMSNWPDLLQWVASNRQTLNWTEEKNVTTKSKSKYIPRKIKGVTNYGFYSLLIHTHESQEYQDHLHLMIGHLLLAQLQIVKNGEISRDQYENFQVTPKQKDIFADNILPYLAELAIRKLSTNDYRSVLTAINPFLHPGQFVKTYCVGSLNPTIRTHKELVDYATFIGVAHLTRSRKKPSLSLGKSHIYNDSSFTKGEPAICIRGERPSKIGDREDIYEDWGEQAVAWERVYSQDSCRKPLRLDICPEELASEHEVFWTEYDCKSTKKGLGMLITSARGQVRQIVMANQHFPWTYSILAVSEITELLTFCSKEFRELQVKNDWSTTDILNAEIISLIHVMLWTGSSLSQAMSFRILRDNDMTDSHIALVLADSKVNRETNEWRVRALTPLYKQIVTAPKDIVRERDSYLFLPDVAKGSSFACILEERVGPSKNGLIFHRKSEEEYAIGIRKFFTDNWKNERFTMEKISNHLFHSLLTHTNDITKAIAITGNAHSLGQAKIFYSTINIDTLRKDYSETTDRIVNNIYKAADKKPKSKAIDTTEQYEGKFVGSRLCTNLKSVKNAIKNLQIELKKSSSYNDRPSFSRYHNLYTLYTLLTISYATAFRAVKSPFLSSNEIDIETGLAVIADKDGPDHHKSRLAWVPPFVIKQIHNYEAHRQATDLFARWSDDLPTCFFINSKYKPVQVLPKIIASHLKKFLPIPPNSHRRFMRMHLLEKGCPTEVVDAYMGHWSRGEEPWGELSSFSFFDYVRVLKEYLLQQLKDLGFTAIRSRIC